MCTNTSTRYGSCITGVSVSLTICHLKSYTCCWIQLSPLGPRGRIPRRANTGHSMLILGPFFMIATPSQRPDRSDVVVHVSMGDQLMDAQRGKAGENREGRREYGKLTRLVEGYLGISQQCQSGKGCAADAMKEMEEMNEEIQVKAPCTLQPSSTDSDHQCPVYPSSFDRNTYHCILTASAPSPRAFEDNHTDTYLTLLQVSRSVVDKTFKDQ